MKTTKCVIVGSKSNGVKTDEEEEEEEN